jgi:hypothetical protein
MKWLVILLTMLIFVLNLSDDGRLRTPKVEVMPCAGISNTPSQHVHAEDPEGCFGENFLLHRGRFVFMAGSLLAVGPPAPEQSAGRLIPSGFSPPRSILDYCCLGSSGGIPL